MSLSKKKKKKLSKNTTMNVLFSSNLFKWLIYYEYVRKHSKVERFFPSFLSTIHPRPNGRIASASPVCWLIRFKSKMFDRILQFGICKRLQNTEKMSFYMDYNEAVMYCMRNFSIFGHRYICKLFKFSIRHVNH